MLEMFTAAPMTANLSGLEVEYAVALIYSSEAGRREATVDVRRGPGHRRTSASAPRCRCCSTSSRPIAVKLRVLDHDGTPTTARFQFVDRQGHVFPPQAKRLAPDLFFQKHIYRAHGETVLLPPGELTMFYGRGPEYRWLRRTVTIPAPGPAGTTARLSSRQIAVQARALDRSGRRMASTAATITSTPPAARTTRRRPRASTRPTCSGRSKAKGSTSAAC